MKMLTSFIFLAISIICAQEADAFEDIKTLYMNHCASCHHAERYGLRAPALIPETLKGYEREDLAGIIRDGLPATQMPPFKELLTDEKIEKIISYLLTPVSNVQWGEEDIIKSKEVFTGEGSKRLSQDIDRENITLVVESGRSVTVMDGGSFKLLDKFRTGAIHGGPKFSYGLRYIYTPTRDGVITKYDLNALEKVAGVKAGINTRNIAISADDRWLAVANYLPSNIVFLDNDLRLQRIIQAEAKIGGIYTLPSHKKFICSFRDLNELWLIDYKRNFATEKLSLPEPFEDISISPLEDLIIGASRKGTRLHVYSLKEKKVVSSFETDGMPHLASATYWVDKGILYAATNHLKKPFVTVMDLRNKRIVKEVGLSGSGFFVRTRQDTPFIWADTNTDAIQLIDKSTLRVAKTLVPTKGKKAMHIEFTKDGRYAMVSVYEEEGELVIYDALEGAEVMRLPFRKPAGKYNALNKTYPGRILDGQRWAMGEAPHN